MKFFEHECQLLYLKWPRLLSLWKGETAMFSQAITRLFLHENSFSALLVQKQHEFCCKPIFHFRTVTTRRVYTKELSGNVTVMTAKFSDWLVFSKD